MARSFGIQSLLLFVFIALANAAIYSGLIVDDPFLRRDDYLVVAPLEEIRGFGDYFEGRSKGRIIDVAPVRDFSFVLNYAIKRATGLSTFHFTNFALWIAVLFLVFKILLLLYSNTTLVLGAVFVYSLHPVFVGTVAWITARKHLLAGFFILWATYLLVKAVRQGTKRYVPLAAAICFLYLLSVLSQPITVLWPLWAMLFVALRNSGNNRPYFHLVLACLPVMVLCVGLNYWYYSGPYLELTRFEKFSSNPDADMGMVLLVVGRYFSNLILPIRLVTVYYPGSWLNLAGLFAIAAFIAVLLKFASRREVITWLSFYFLMLAPVTVRLTNILVSDTYVITAAFGILCLLILLFEKIASAWPAIAMRLGVSACVLMSVAYASLSAQNAKAWQSDFNLWKHAYETEPSPHVLYQYMDQLIRSHSYQEATRIGYVLREWVPQDPLAHWQWSRAIYENAGLTTGQKIAEIEKNSDSSPGRDYFLGLLYAEKEDFRKAFNLIAGHIFSSSLYANDLMRITAQAYSFCNEAGARDCHRFVNAVSAKYPKLWKHEDFTEQVRTLGFSYEPGEISRKTGSPEH